MNEHGRCWRCLAILLAACAPANAPALRAEARPNAVAWSGSHAGAASLDRDGDFRVRIVDLKTRQCSLGPSSTWAIGRADGGYVAARSAGRETKLVWFDFRGMAPTQRTIVLPFAASEILAVAQSGTQSCAVTDTRALCHDGTSITFDAEVELQFYRGKATSQLVASGESLFLATEQGEWGGGLVRIDRDGTLTWLVDRQADGVSDIVPWPAGCVTATLARGRGSVMLGLPQNVLTVCGRGPSTRRTIWNDAGSPRLLVTRRGLVRAFHEQVERFTDASVVIEEPAGAGSACGYTFNRFAGGVLVGWLAGQTIAIEEDAP